MPDRTASAHDSVAEVQVAAPIESLCGIMVALCTSSTGMVACDGTRALQDAA